jgi:hypothetical protein
VRWSSWILLGLTSLGLRIVKLNCANLCNQDGKVSQLEHVFIRGSKVRYIQVFSTLSILHSPDYCHTSSALLKLEVAWFSGSFAHSVTAYLIGTINVSRWSFRFLPALLIFKSHWVDRSFMYVWCMAGSWSFQTCWRMPQCSSALMLKSRLILPAFIGVEILNFKWSTID